MSEAVEGLPFEQPASFEFTPENYALTRGWMRITSVLTRYEAQAVTPWLANLSMTAHIQRTERQLQNLLPVQFPAPTPVAFFPITVFRLDVLSRTEQRVWTPGVDVQAVFTPVMKHVLTTGLTFYRDRSSDDRTTSTTTSTMRGNYFSCNLPQRNFSHFLVYNFLFS